jgi:uncharacterized protein YndB with AHSA1/START domain
MSTVTVSTHIAAPLERVFRVFTDIEHVTDYVDGIEAVELLTPGDFRLGARWRETRHLLGRSDSAEMEVTSYERNRTYTISHTRAGARISTVFTFEPAGDGTQITVEFAIDGQGLPPGLLAPVGWAIDAKVREVLEKDLADLKAASEGTRDFPRSPA